MLKYNRSYQKSAAVYHKPNNFARSYLSAVDVSELDKKQVRNEKWKEERKRIDKKSETGKQERNAEQSKKENLETPCLSNKLFSRALSS